MKSHQLLLSMVFVTEPCVSPQVFHGSRRLAGGSQSTATGLKPPKQCSQPGSLNPGAALESDGMVKLIKHSQASSPRTSHKRLFKAWAKRQAVRIGLSNVARRECCTASVKSGPNLSCGRCGTWKSRFSSSRLGCFQGKPTARQAQGRRHGEDRTSQGRSVMDRIRPRRSGLSLSENRWNRTY